MAQAGRWAMSARAALRRGACILAALWVPATAEAQWLLEETSILNLSVGSSRSALAQGLSLGGYELADGTPVRFADWYTPAVPDLNLLFLTRINRNFGITWGLATGERGETYSIQPGLWLGFVYRVELSRHSSLTFSALTLLGGDFSERPCVADYGPIGGIQSVNCRLAASTLPPADTLRFLVNARGFNETRLSIRYEIRF